MTSETGAAGNRRRNRRRRDGERRDRIGEPAPPHRERRATSATGAATSEAGAAHRAPPPEPPRPIRQPAPPVEPGDRPETAAPRPESFVSSLVSVAPGLRPWRFFRLGAVLPGLLSSFAPVGCWPGCRPSVVRGDRLTVVRAGAFFGFFSPVEVVCWIGGPSSPCAAEPLESGSATATAPPAPPISRPAASTQTPAAKRKYDKTTICSPQPQDSPAVQRLPHCRIVRPSGVEGIAS